MLTRRQKNSLRGVTAALTCSALLSAVLIYTNISNAEKTDVVVFSDILEGAAEYRSDGDTPAVTLASDEMLETMYSEQYATFTLPDAPSHSVTYISPEAVYPEETRTADSNDIVLTSESTADTTVTSGTSAAEGYDALFPDNPNEITLLSEDLENLRSETSAVSYGSSGNAYGYASSSAPMTTVSATASVPTGTTTYITAPTSTTTTTAPGTAVTTTSRTTARTTVTTTAAPTTAATTSATTVTKRTTTATAANGTSHTSKTPFTNVGGGTFSNDDNVYLTLLKLVNDARRDAGVPELWYSARVHEVCELRATELSSYYSHNRPDGSRFSTAFREIGINYLKCGENIAYGRNMFETPEEVFQAWMDSESHRENILSPDFECVAFGLSVLTVGSDTYYYWTQEFASFA